MKSSLRNVLPREIDDETEAAVLEIIRRKMLGSTGLLVRVVRAMEARFGTDTVHEVVREVVQKVNPRPVEVLRTPEEDLADYMLGDLEEVVADPQVHTDANRFLLRRLCRAASGDQKGEGDERRDEARPQSGGVVFHPRLGRRERSAHKHSFDVLFNSGWCTLRSVGGVCC